MKKLSMVLPVFAFAFALGAQAEVRTWVGGKDNAWGTAANWSPEGVPTASDTAVFAVAATVNVGSAFGGIIQVTNNVVVTLDLSADVTMQGMVETGSTLQKQGTGTLTLSPVEGLRQGTISVLGGTVDFRKNVDGVPSMFGKLIVAAGANANVTDSPADNRHGFLIRYRDEDAASCTREIFNEKVSSIDKWKAAWQTEEFTTSAYTSSTDYEHPFGCDGNNAPFLLPPYNTYDKEYFFAMGRGIAVFHPETGNQTLSLVYRSDDCSGLYVNNVQVAYREWDGTSTTTVSVSPGLNDVGLCCLEMQYAQYLRFNFHIPTNPDGWMYPDTLWNGVCFNGIDLNANATLTIAADQAVGFATINNDKVKGSVVGGEGAFFSLLGGTVALNETAFADFDGTIEVGRHATVVGETDEAVATFGKNYLWYGKFVATGGATWDLTGEDLGAAVVEIETGTRVMLDQEDALSNKIRGGGDLIVKGGTTVSDFNTREFTGSVSLVDARVEVDNVALIKDRELKVKHVLGDFTSGMWATTGTVFRTTDNGRDVVPCRFFDEQQPGTLIMTDDIAQRSLAYLTNVTVRLDEPWEVAFTYGVYPLTYLKDLGYGLSHAEGLAFTIAPVSLKGAGFTGSYRAPNHSEGFFFRTYADNPTKRFWWVRDGITDSATAYTAAQLGNITFIEKPIDVKVSYDGDGSMTVRLSQDDKVWETTRPLHVLDAYKDGDFYFTFVSQTGYWDNNTTRPGSYHKVWDFSGSVYARADVDGVEQDAFALCEENWVLDTSVGVTTLEDGRLVMATNQSTCCFAQCKTPLKYSDAWKATFKYEITAHLNTGGEGFAMFIQPNDPMTMKADKGAGDFAQPTGSYGIGFYPWLNKVQWVVNKSLGEQLDTSLKISRLGLNLPIDVTIVYDGAGRMEFILDQAGVTRETWVCTIPAGAFELDQDVYFGFSYRASSWACYIQNSVYDFKLEKYENIPPVTIEDELTVGAGGTVTLSVGHVGAASVVNMVYPSVLLEANSTLAVTNKYEGVAYRVRLNDVKFPATGNGTITSHNGTTVLSRLVFSGDSPSEHKISGLFAAPDGLEVVIPSTWKNLAMPLVLADVSEVSWEGGATPTITLVDEDGNALNLKASVSGGKLHVYKQGFLFIVR